MTLDNREYMNERAPFRLSEDEKERRLAKMRRRFNAALSTEPPERSIEIWLPETTAGVIALGASAGLALAAVMILVAQYIF